MPNLRTDFFSDEDRPAVLADLGDVVGGDVCIIFCSFQIQVVEIF